MTDLNSLVVFAKVVEAKSFSGAARHLKMPVSTVSRRIADLENELGVRLLERTTRSVRPTEVGAEILELAQRSAELVESVNDVVSYQRSTVSGILRLSAPPSIADSLIVPLIGGFQAAYPDVKVRLFVTDRLVDHVVEGIDIAFRIAVLESSSLVARKILTYRRRLVASPSYMANVAEPECPQDLLALRLLAFSHRTPEHTWNFSHIDGVGNERLKFVPYIAMNDFIGLASALAAGAGIGELPPIVQPELLRSGQLVEVMPAWRFPTLDLSIVHVGSLHMARHVRLFKEFVVDKSPSLFVDLPV